MDFIEDAYEFINDELFPHIEAFYTAAGRAKPTSLRSHLDGTHPIYITVLDMFSGAAGRAAGHFLAPGKMKIDRTWINCIQNRYDTLSDAEALCALIDLAVTAIVHETAHIVYHGEDFASGLEGFVRHAVQKDLGFITTSGTTTTAACGQVSWSCGGDITSAACSGDALQRLERSLFESISTCAPS